MVTKRLQNLSPELIGGWGGVLHHVSSPTRWNGSRGQVWPGNEGKTKLKSYFVFLGLISTKIRFSALSAAGFGWSGRQ